MLALLKIGSLPCAAIAIAMIGMTALAPTTLAQQALQGAGPCPVGEVLLPGADKKPPTLDTNWAPIGGTAVKPGDQIKVTMVARDDPNPRPSGIKTIQLVADSEDGRLVASENYEPCSEGERRVEATYTVPANPPPVVRLTALAEDHAGLMDTDVGEFPTSVEPGDTADSEPDNRTDYWYGTIKKTAKGGGHNHTIDVDFAFEIETGGMINGRARARVRTEEGEVPGCTMLWTYSPSEFDIPLSGRRDGENFEIALEPGTTTATFAGCGQSNTFPGHLNPAVHAETKYRISAQDGATNTVERNAGALPWGVIMRDTIEIHQARQ